MKILDEIHRGLPDPPELEAAMDDLYRRESSTADRIESLKAGDSERTHEAAIQELLGFLEDIGLDRIARSYREQSKSLGWTT